MSDRPDQKPAESEPRETPHREHRFEAGICSACYQLETRHRTLNLPCVSEEEAEYLGRAREFIDAKIMEHLEILRRKYLQTRIFDDYGNWIPDKFVQEVEYFKAKVLLRDWPDFYAANKNSTMEEVPFAERWWWIGLQRIFVFLMAAYVHQAILLRVQTESTTATSSPVLSETMPAGFEERCATSLESCGWKVNRTGRSGDQGVDLLAEKAGVRVVLQCKLYSGPVGNKAVQEAFAGKEFVDAHVAAVVTNSTYTPAARVLAAKNAVLLLYYDELSSLDEKLPDA